MASINATAEALLFTIAVHAAPEVDPRLELPAARAGPLFQLMNTNMPPPRPALEGRPLRAAEKGAGVGGGGPELSHGQEIRDERYSLDSADLCDLALRGSIESFPRGSQDSASLLRGSLDSLTRGSLDSFDSGAFYADDTAMSDVGPAWADLEKTMQVSKLPQSRDMETTGGGSSSTCSLKETAPFTRLGADRVGAASDSDQVRSTCPTLDVVGSSETTTTASLQTTLGHLKSRGCFIESSNRDCASLLEHADKLHGLLATSKTLTRKCFT